MKNESGAMLIMFIIFIAIIGILGSSMAYLTKNVTYALKATNSIDQSYYLAESGLRYAIMQIQDEVDFKKLKEKFEDNDHVVHIPKSPDEGNAGNFTLKFYQPSGDRDIFIHSIAHVYPKSVVEARRQVNAKYNRSTDHRVFEFETDDFDQDQTSREWNLNETFYAKTETANDVFALQLISTSQKCWVLASLNWGHNNALVDLRQWQNATTKVLSYKTQLKFTFYPWSGQYKKDFMAGLNFRVYNSQKNYRKRTDFYGISFFKSSGREQSEPPCWIESDSPDCDQELGYSFLFHDEDEICRMDSKSKCLDRGAPYVIFWIKKKNRPIELLAFSDLRDLPQSEKEKCIESLGFNNWLQDYEWGFKKWLTLGLHLREEESAGQKINEIQVYLRPNSSNVSDVNSNIEWEPDWNFPVLLRFQKVKRSDLSSETILRDRTLISADLIMPDQVPPDEIGFHALYDNRLESLSQYNIYFDDFAVECSGDQCPEEEPLYLQY